MARRITPHSTSHSRGTTGAEFGGADESAGRDGSGERDGAVSRKMKRIQKYRTSYVDMSALSDFSVEQNRKSLEYYKLLR